MHSCIYDGRVTHRRLTPVKHQFQYRLFMVYLDLQEVPGLMRSGMGISQRAAAPASFLRSDHLVNTGESLDEVVRKLVAERTGVRPRGPIRLLTQLRYFGFYFSPLNLYYCFDPQGEEVESIVAEVSNTPWREQHCYVLWEGNREAADAGLQFTHAKSFHVSPFMDMDADYRWRLSQPGVSLDISLMNTRCGEPLFEAGLAMTRRPLTRWQLTRAMLRFPLMTAQIVAAIYYQALRLWIKKCPYYPHPNKSAATASLRR